MYHYKTRGTCSRAISFEITDGKLYNVHFDGGCNGNTQGICKLTEGKDAVEVMELLRGIDCNYKGTSCPDQLSKAIEAALEEAK